MTMQSSGQIKMSEIALEKLDSALPGGGYWQNISLRGCSVDSVNDFTYYNGDSLITADYPGTPNSATPHQISEFYSWSPPLPSHNYTVTSTDTTVTRNMARDSYGNWVIVGQQFRPHLELTSLGGPSYRLTAKIKTTGSPPSGTITTNNLVGNSTGTTNFYVSNQTISKTMFTVDLNYAKFPDSYKWVTSGTFSGSSGLARSFSYANGGATYTNNPPNTIYTFDTTGTFPASYSTNVNVQDECGSFSTTLTTSLQLVFRKSGYADTNIGPACTVITNSYGSWLAGTCM